MVQTYKDKFNIKYKFAKGTAHSIEEIAKLTGYMASHLKIILSLGQGAFFSNPKSVRPQVKSSTEWGMARIYSAVMGGKAARVDASHLIKKK